MVHGLCQPVLQPTLASSCSCAQGIPLLGVIPEDTATIGASNQGMPLVLKKPPTMAALALEAAAWRLAEGLSFLLDFFLFGIIMACSVGNKVVKAVKTCGMGEVVFVKRLVPFK